MTASVSIDPAVRREVQSDYFRYLLPTLIGQIAHSFYCMADVFFVGAAVGSDGLAALNVALPIFTLFSAFSLMVGVGTATTASILTGQGPDPADQPGLYPVDGTAGSCGPDPDPAHLGVHCAAGPGIRRH